MDYINSIYASGLKLRAKAVYMYLKSRYDKERKCFPSINTIAKDLDISQSTVKRTIVNWKVMGILKRLRDTVIIMGIQATYISTYIF